MTRTAIIKQWLNDTLSTPCTISKENPHSSLPKALDSTSDSEEDDDDSTLGSPTPNGVFQPFYESQEEEQAPPPPKRARSDEPGQYSSVAQKLMSKMGYEKGRGLGRSGQGIVEPVEMSTQRGRRGLGHIVKGLEEESVEWDSSREHVDDHETVQWMPPCSSSVPSLEMLRGWKREGSRRKEIIGETQFCDPEVLSNVLRCKSVFDRLEKLEMHQARTRSNPFETIRSAFFLNRAAMKMANLDAVLDFMFSDPSKSK